MKNKLLLPSIILFYLFYEHLKKLVICITSICPPSLITLIIAITVLFIGGYIVAKIGEYVDQDNSGEYALFVIFMYCPIYPLVVRGLCFYFLGS